MDRCYGGGLPQDLQHAVALHKKGMVFSPDKFQFAKETVEFVGFMITMKGIKPMDRYLETIRNFPTPTNITDICSWYGLINQVAYAFSKT